MPRLPSRPLSWPDVTPKPLWLNRRKLIAGGAALLATPALSQITAAKSPLSTDATPNTTPNAVKNDRSLWSHRLFSPSETVRISSGGDPKSLRTG